MNTQNNNNVEGGHNNSHHHNNDHSHSHDHHNVSNSTLMGVLAYLGPLVIISYLVSKNDPFVKFHIKQGLVIVAIQIILWLLSPIASWQIWDPTRLIHLALLVLIIIGIVNVINKKEKMLPVVGGLT